MLSTLLVVLLAQVPCTPGEMSVVCNCKQGMVNACVTLAGDDPLKAAEVLDEVVGMLKVLEQTSQMAREGDRLARPEPQGHIQGVHEQVARDLQPP